jgi:hypothetical protein
MAASAWAVSFSRCVNSGAGPTFRRAGVGGSREATSAASWATCAMGGRGLATGRRTATVALGSPSAQPFAPCACASAAHCRKHGGVVVSARPAVAAASAGGVNSPAGGARPGAARPACAGACPSGLRAQGLLGCLAEPASSAPRKALHAAASCRHQALQATQSPGARSSLWRRSCDPVHGSSRRGQAWKVALAKPLCQIQRPISLEVGLNARNFEWSRPGSAAS